MIRAIYILAGLLLIALAALQNLLWLVGLFAIVFSWFFGAAWLFLAAVLIDGYFNAFAGWPLFSLVAVLWYVAAELLRVKMRIMN